MKLNSSDGLKTGTITTIVYSNYYTDLTDKNATVRHVLYKPSQDVIANILSAYNEEEDNSKH